MEQLLDQIRTWRRHLHAIPEIGFQEYKTSKYLYEELEKMGYHPLKITETGIAVYLDFHKEKTLAFRSDIDALEIEEQTGVSFKSTHQGKMHACGHDGHMSALLGFAKRLKEIKEPLNYNILLLFQPAEESPGAARLVVESGVLEKYHVKAIFGMHLMPMIEEGKIACKSGPLMAMCGEMDVTIHGQGAHAGLPQEGIDSIMIANHAYMQYQTMISRHISPFSPVIFNIGEIHGGTARNSVATQTCMHGTLRCYDESLFHKMTQEIQAIHDGLMKSYNCQIEWSCPPMYPPVMNHQSLYQQLKACVDPSTYIELDEPLMLAEDFAFYQKAIPGVFFFVGTKCQEYQSGLHTDTFDFHEEVLETAVDLYEKLARNIKGV